MPKDPIIDWDKIQADPEKDWKVVGQLLIDNRNKIEAIERELEESENTGKKWKGALEQANSKIKELENQTERLAELEKEIEKTQNEKERLSTQIKKKDDDYESRIQQLTDESKTKIQKIKDDYEQKIHLISSDLQDKSQSLELAEDHLKHTSDHQDTLSETVAAKNKEIEELNNIIEEKNKEINEINMIIEEKNNMMARISEDLKERKDETMELIQKIKDRDSKIEELSKKVEVPAPTPPTPTHAPASLLLPATPTPTKPTLTRPTPVARTPTPGIPTPSITADMDWKDSDEPLKVLKVDGDEITEAEGLESNQVGIIIDKKSGTIWVWKGSSASRLNAIRASTKAPSIRSGYMLYGWKVEFIDQGEEPDYFPPNIIPS